MYENAKKPDEAKRMEDEQTLAELSLTQPFANKMSAGANLQLR